MPQLTEIFKLSRREFVTFEAVILGVPSAPPVVNLIFLLIKQHIVSSKLSIDRVSEPRLNSIYEIITKFAQAEYLVEENNNKVEKCRQKWRALFDTSGNLLLRY